MLLCTWARSTLSLSHNSAHDIDTRARGPGGGVHYISSARCVLSSVRRPLFSPASSPQPRVLSSARRPLFSPTSSLQPGVLSSDIFSPACPHLQPGVSSLQPGASSLQPGVLSSASVLSPARRPLSSPASSLQPGVLSSARRPLFSPACPLFSLACPLFSPARPLFSPALSLQPASSLQPGVLSSARRPLFSPEMPKCEWSRVECHAHEGEVPKIVLAAFFGKGYYGPFFGVQYCNGNIRKACQK